MNDTLMDYHQKKETKMKEENQKQKEEELSNGFELIDKEDIVVTSHNKMKNKSNQHII
tara:strand:+ start:246 stop:419 length:174 start_codon:yes stop_codon:yes gene_type:complete